jgi:polyisoprenoid-binding protein YceI
MKNFYLFLMLTILSLSLSAQNSVKFRIKNAGLTVPGYFGSFKPLVSWDKSNPTAARFIGTVDVNSVNTSNSARDKHLKSTDFFDVAKYPSMKFESTSVSSVSSDRIKITGKLTIKDVTKTVTFDTKVTTSGSKTIFSATLLINRLEYNIGTSSWTLANDLYIDLNIEK